MNITAKTQKQIHQIWDDYVKSDKKVMNNKGEVINEIDSYRKDIIVHLKKLIDEFKSEDLNIHEFKTSIDSLNKRNNLWGFTAAKGQMFFNQLVKTSSLNEKDISQLIKEVIDEPKNLIDAQSKIMKLEKYTYTIYNKAKDKRKAPKPGSIGYFLSYFWQVHDHIKWPIIYTSLSNAYKELEIWEEGDSQSETYAYFYNINENMKGILKKHTSQNISNWDAEHAFWNFSGNPNAQIIDKRKSDSSTIDSKSDSSVTQSNFNYKDYVMPRVANLIALGADVDSTSSKKGAEYEKMVSEAFEFLDFEVDKLGQGKGRNPDAILKFREENIAFIIDAKAYSDGYSLGVDDRAIKEYINHHCPKLIKEGYKRIGFILVSNSYKSDFTSFINDVTWETDIKRFILLTSEALLHLLAYKIKDHLSLSQIIDSLIGFENPVEASSVNEEFYDV